MERIRAAYKYEFLLISFVFSGELVYLCMHIYTEAL